MSLSDVLGFSVLFAIIISSVVLAAKFIKYYLGKKITKMLLWIALPFMMIIPGVIFLPAFVLEQAGFKSEIAQLIIVAFSIVGVHILIDRLVMKMAEKKNKRKSDLETGANKRSSGGTGGTNSSGRVEGWRV